VQCNDPRRQPHTHTHIQLEFMTLYQDGIGPESIWLQQMNDPRHSTANMISSHPITINVCVCILLHCHANCCCCYYYLQLSNNNHHNNIIHKIHEVQNVSRQRCNNNDSPFCECKIIITAIIYFYIGFMDLICE